MSDLAIAWEYLTGYCVASHASHRERAEWPPHPARVYMAMAAAWFESEPLDRDIRVQNEYKAEGAALRWLESLGDPEISLPTVTGDSFRTETTQFVPVGDKAEWFVVKGKETKTFPLNQNARIGKILQPRSFPRLYVGNDPCVQRWRNVTNYETHKLALSRLCEKVTRIGHSTSLVMMWIASEVEVFSDDRNSLTPDATATDERMRTVTDGFLEILIDRFGKDPRDQHQSLSQHIELLKTSQKQIKGKGAKEAKSQIDEQINGLEFDLAKIVPNPVVRPAVSRWSGYRKQTLVEDRTAGHTGFDTDVLVLAAQTGLRLSAASTLMVTETLRRTIMSVCADPIPAWISGHQAKGDPVGATVP